MDFIGDEYNWSNSQCILSPSVFYNLDYRKFSVDLVQCQDADMGTSSHVGSVHSY